MKDPKYEYGTVDWGSKPCLEPLPDFRIKIRCTKRQQFHFVLNSCPDRFDQDWMTSFLCGSYRLGSEVSFEKCLNCWSKYVEWEITDESDLV